MPEPGTHVDDIAAAFLILVEETLKPSGGKAQWGRQGYYFADGAEFVGFPDTAGKTLWLMCGQKWGDVSKAIAVELHKQGALQTSDVDKLSVEDAVAQHPWAPLLWGGNCRSRSDRLRQLGWKPQGPSLYDSLPSMLTVEIKTLGKQSSTTTFDK